MQRLKSSLKRLIRSAGYYVATREYAEDYVPTLHLAKLLRERRIECVLDVGGNIGQFRDFLRDEIGFNGKIVSFEPVPAQARR